MSMYFAKSTITHRNDIYPFISPTRFPVALADKIVFILDADRGIDRAFALAFAAIGASVACVPHRQTDIDSTMAEIQQRQSMRAIAIAANVADLALAPRMVAKVVKKLGPVNILLNCAGMTRFEAFKDEEGMDG